MPRVKQEIVTASGPNGIVAAAVRLTGRRNGKPDRKPKRPPQWYMRAWEFYDTIGEYRYAVTWVGNLLSRARLEVWEDGKETKNQHAIAALEALFGGEEGQREMLRQLGTHLTVPGEAYIVGEDMGDDPDSWSVVSATRISSPTKGVWKVGGKELDDPLVIRIWRPHPMKQEESDSPSRAVLPVLAEIEAMGKYLAAQSASRLTGAGVFAIPSEITFGSVRSMVANSEQTTVSSGVDAFLREFVEVASAATADPDDPSARVPIILQGPGEFLDKLNHITFWSELDEHAKEIRDDAIRRLGLGMDMPPEILTGTGDMNHWNSWQVEEASIKAHTEPLLQIIMSSLTDSYLRPYLEDAGGMSREEARAFKFHADTSKIRLRPNRSKEAIELYEHGELSAAAMLRENGFDPADAMSEEERKAWLTKKVASGSTTPELVAWALSIMGVPVPQTALMIERTTEAPSNPSLLEHPTRDIPDVTEVTASAASSVVIHRALERAGARLKSKYKSTLVPGAEQVANEKVYRYANIDTEMQDDLLVGAWECIETLGLDSSPLELDSYVRHLFRTNEQFTVKHFQNWREKS